MRFSRSLGQVFLKDNKYIRKVIAALNTEDEIIFEIGAGRAELTSYLYKKAKFLYSIEVDFRLYSLLKNRFKNQDNVEIIHADILKFPFSQLKKKMVIVGNVPYQISSDIIRCLVRERKRIKKAYLTYQKEFAQKLTAGVSDKSYGSLTCYLQYYAEVKRLFDIPRQAFCPVPRVDSSFLQIIFYHKLQSKALSEEFLFRIIKQAFTQRRKKIINSLPFLKGKEELLSALKINPAGRADSISLQDYVKLANALYKNNLPPA